MLFQSGALFDSMNVFDNLAFPLREHRGSRERRDRRAASRELLDAGAAAGDRGASCRPTSRAACASASRWRARWRSSPRTLLFDEPTTGPRPDDRGVDRPPHPRTAASACTPPSVVVTHDLALARTVADRIAFLDEGRFRFVGTWTRRSASGDALIEHFLAGQRGGREMASGQRGARLRVGLLVVGASLALMAGLFMIGEQNRLFAHKNHYLHRHERRRPQRAQPGAASTASASGSWSDHAPGRRA